MNYLDLTLIILIAGSVAAGFWNGFVRTAVGSVAAVAALICALWFYGTTGFWLRPYIPSKPLANFTGFLIVFSAILLLGAVAGWLMAKLVRATRLSWLDRLLGGAFGVIRGALIATIAVLVLMAFAPKPLPAFIRQSGGVPLLTETARVLATAAPNEVRDGFRRACRDLETALPDPLKKPLTRLTPDAI